MPRNELVLLDQLFETRQAQRAQPSPVGEAFELFSAELVLKHMELSDDEIAAGIVGGGNDGALDAVYVFLGDNLIDEDSDVLAEAFSPSSVPRGIALRLWLVQAKHEASFGETPLDLAGSSLGRLLDLATETANLRQLYSDAVVDHLDVFRRAWWALTPRHPHLEVRFVYASRGEAAAANAKVIQKRGDLEAQLARLVPNGTASVELVGAEELWQLASRDKQYELQLPFVENTESANSYVALVALKDYLAFLTNPDGSIRRHIFDLNVRDYQGAVEVNKDIETSLRSTDAPDFWWLNNGITIVTSQASTANKTFTLSDVQVVNGLQTSFSVHAILSGLLDTQPQHPAFSRHVMVRILETSDPRVRDQVIKATNHQTVVSTASLRATDDIQRAIEAFFLAHDWYYDRRKNYHKNAGRNPERIVSIPLLAQAIMAMGLSSPDNSRARPSSLLKSDADYAKIFSQQIDLPTYLWAAVAQKAVDSFLVSESAAAPTAERTNIRFHLAMVAATRLVGQRIYDPAQLKQVVQESRLITEAGLEACLADLRAWMGAYAAKTGDGQDKIAKSSGFVTYIHEQIAAAKS